MVMYVKVKPIWCDETVWKNY